MTGIKNSGELKKAFGRMTPDPDGFYSFRANEGDRIIRSRWDASASPNGEYIFEMIGE